MRHSLPIPLIVIGMACLAACTGTETSPFALADGSADARDAGPMPDASTDPAHEAVADEGLDLASSDIAPLDVAAPDQAGTNDVVEHDTDTAPDRSVPDAGADTRDTADGSVEPAPVPERILFIGNSFTFGGPIPTLVDALANDAGWPDPEVVYSAYGGETLGGHRDRETTVGLVDEGDWDVVVLQEQSTRPTDNLGDPDRFKTDATWFHDRIKASSPDARVVLFETWARRADHAYYPGSFDDPTEMQDQLSYHYHDAAESWIPANATAPVVPPVAVAPVGDAWAHHLAQPEAVNLHHTDAWHAGTNGQYLTALVIYGTIYDRSVANLTSLELSPVVAARLQADADAVTGRTTPGGPDGTTLPVGLVPGQRVLLDIGGDPPGEVAWNHLSEPVGGALGNLQATDGERTTVDIAVTDNFGGDNGAGIAENELGWPGEATQDSFFCGSFDDHDAGLLAPGQLTLSGLDPSGSYALTLFAARAGTDGGRGRLTRYTVTGSASEPSLSVDLEVADNTADTAVFENVLPSDVGTVVVDVGVSPVGTGRFCYLGALVIER